MPQGSTIAALKVFLGIDMAEFDGGLRAARNQLARTGKQMEAIGRQISETGARLSIGLSLPLAAFGAATVKAASDAQEMGSAFRYVFGAAARDVEVWAEKTGNALGRSTYVLQQQALTFQQLFKQAAPTNAAAAEMSKQFTLLAQDLASFFNVAEDDALQKLRAGLVGEAEPLRAFGVFLTAAAVEAQAFKMGLAATSKELTEQDKILARAALIMQATKDAQGDAARTSDSFANKSKALKAALNELQVSLGTALLPALTQVAKALASALTAFNQLSPGAQQSAIALAGVAIAIGPANVAIGAMRTGVGAAIKAIAGLTAGAGGLRVAMTGLAGFLGPGGLLVIGLAAAGVAALALFRYFKDLKTASAEVQAQTGKLATATDDYRVAASLAASASGEARVSYLKEAAAKRELAIQTRAATLAQLNQARATLAQLQADNARAIQTDRYSFRGDAAGTIKPVLNSGQVSKAKANLDELQQKIAAATKSIADSDKILQAGASVSVTAANTVAASATKKKEALDKEAKALADAKSAVLEYLSAEQKAFAERGVSDAEVKAREAMTKAHEAYLLGLKEEARQLVEIAAAYRVGDVELKKLQDTQVDFITTPADLKPQWSTAWEDFIAQVQDAEEAFYRTRNAVDDLFYGIRNNDWVSAFGGLMRAIDQIKTAFDSAASSGDRMAAAAGAVDAVGNMVGGKVGGALKGAAQGAQIGMTLGGPIGAGIGAVIGGIGGLFGASKAKKRAKREAKRRAEEEAARKAAELAAAKRSLEIRLMELSGNSAGALAAQREDELAAMDASLREMQKDVWAREDAAQLVAATRAFEIEKLQALGREEEALAMIRADALAALPAEMRALQQSVYDVIDATAAAEAAQDRLASVRADQADRISAAEDQVADARSEVGEAIQDEISALEQVRDAFAEVADQLSEFRGELDSGAFGNLSLGKQLTAAEKAFAAVEGRTDADSLARLPELGRALIEARSATAPNARALQATIDRVRAATVAGEAAARGQISAQERQIQALTQTGVALGVLNQNVVTLTSAQDRLAEAITAQSAVMRSAADAIAAASAGLDAAMAAVAQAANANVAPVTSAAVDVASAAASLDASVAAGAGATDAAAVSMADRVVAGLLPAVEAGALQAALQVALLKRWNVDGMPEVRDLDAA